MPSFRVNDTEIHKSVADRSEYTHFPPYERINSNLEFVLPYPVLLFRDCGGGYYFFGRDHKLSVCWEVFLPLLFQSFEPPAL